MKIALISDAFIPLRTSGAIQMLDLARALARAGHEVVVMTPGYNLEKAWSIEERDGFRVLRLRSPPTKDLPYVLRAWAEWRMPFAMCRNWQLSPLRDCAFEGAVFYSPSIFHSPLVRAIKRKCGARSYLILRDIFPDWALDMGLLKRGPVYTLLHSVARGQFRAADVVGVQSPGNLNLVRDSIGPGTRLEVLHNWLEPRPAKGCRIDFSSSALAGRKVCVYAGNVGVAQQLDVIVEVAEFLRARRDIGFAIVGRGNDTARIAGEIASRALDNIVLFDEIEPDEIPGLYSQCSVGLVVLDERHRTHNIPGKFVSYMHAGLPAFAIVNPNNDIIDLINSTGVGAALDQRAPGLIAKRLVGLLDELDSGTPLVQRCENLAGAQFSAVRAATQIVEGLRQ